MTEIHPLAECPNAIATLSGWFYSEWNSFDGRSIAEIEAQLHQNISRDAVPITFVAVRDAAIIGTVSLDVSDLPGFDHLSPWLASLFVAPGFRGAGVGSALVQRVTDFARAKGIRTLYLWTAGSTRFYERCGWRMLQATTYGGQSISVLQRSEQASN